jgi:3-oxoadipate enol-lactonase
MAAMAHAALEALERAAPGEPAVVIGLSMGGYIAAEFVRSHPDRLAGLVMCDTRAGAESAEGRAGRDTMIDAVRRYGVTHGTAPLVERMLHDPPRALMSEVEAMVEQQDPEVVIACIEAMRDRRDNMAAIRSLTAPFVVIAGEYDELAPRLVEEALAHLTPHGRYVEIPRSGHVPPLENPEAFNAALEEFLVPSS